jgi:hypothetical protein
MSTSASAASSRAHGPSHWGQLNHVLGEWWQHLRSRSELESLDDSMLRGRAAKSDRRIKANLDELTNQGLQFGVDRLAFACRFLTQVRNEAPPQRVERSYTILREGKDG